MALVNVCHGCLAIDRKLYPLREHVTLYHRVLLKKSNDNTMMIHMCWECHKILSNIHTFRMRVTHAQRLLNNNTWKNNPLSNLAKSHTVDDYEIIVYEDEKPCVYTEPMVYDIEVKNEKYEYNKGTSEIIKDAEIAITDLKKELNDDVSNSFDERNDFFGDINSFDNVDDKKNVLHDIDSKEFQPGELFPGNVELGRDDETKVVKTRRKRGPLIQKYRTVVIADIVDKRRFYKIEKIDQETVDKWVQCKKMKTMKKNFQCAMCYCGFKQRKLYDRHITLKHNEKYKYTCDTCSFRFPILSQLRQHIADHYVQFVCRLCARVYSSRDQLYVHLTCGPHSKQLECTKCDMRFDCNKSKAFFEHYRAMHGSKVCDYCGKGFRSKKKLAHHIKIRHTVIVCKICNVKFSCAYALKKHNERKHVVDESERNYCVECDIKFINSILYNDHITRSSKHIVKPRVPCPECDRTYAKRCNMMNHYNMQHSKQCKNICPICNKMFLTGHRLRHHIQYTHEKQPKPKNYICIYCGRGFNTRRILDNHIRTHTGERPFACERCSAAFTQKQALKTHMRSAHK